MSIVHVPQYGYFVALLSQQKSAWGKTLREAMEKLL